METYKRIRRYVVELIEILSSSGSFSTSSLSTRIERLRTCLYRYDLSPERRTGKIIGRVSYIRQILKEGFDIQEDEETLTRLTCTKLIDSCCTETKRTSSSSRVGGGNEEKDELVFEYTPLLAVMKALNKRSNRRQRGATPKPKEHLMRLKRCLRDVLDSLEPCAVFDLNLVRDAFLVYDEERKGRIDRVEFGQVLRRHLRWTVSSSDLQRLVDLLVSPNVDRYDDEERNCSVDYAVFQAALAVVTRQRSTTPTVASLSSVSKAAKRNAIENIDRRHSISPIADEEKDRKTDVDRRDETLSGAVANAVASAIERAVSRRRERRDKNVDDALAAAGPYVRAIVAQGAEEEDEDEGKKKRRSETRREALFDGRRLTRAVLVALEEHDLNSLCELITIAQRRYEDVVHECERLREQLDTSAARPTRENTRTGRKKTTRASRRAWANKIERTVGPGTSTMAEKLLKRMSARRRQRAG